MVELITNVNNTINGFVWGVPMLVLLVGTGILMTILTKFFQLSHIGHWFKNTVGGIFHDKHVTKHTDADDQSISQFQSLCTALVGQAFATVFGSFGPAFIAIAILLFAFSTVLGWSHYGSKACEYLFGTKSTMVYKIAFVLMIFIGCTMNLGLAWDLSDTFNGLMAIPNLIGVTVLSPVVMKITRNYVARIIKKEDVNPMLSVFPEIQGEQEKAM